MKINLHLVIFTNLNSKIEGLNVRPKTIKLLVENIGSMLFNFDISNTYFGRI